VIAIEDDMDLSPLNLGIIAAYYYISYTTIELFANSLTAKTKIKGLLEIISAANEFDSLPMRPGEEATIERLLKHAHLSVDKPRYGDPHTKANALLQAHFSRTPISGDLATDQRVVVTQAVRLLQVSRGLEGGIQGWTWGGTGLKNGRRDACCRWRGWQRANNREEGWEQLGPGSERVD
jgi:pre-mRNA-splicing helicase BRR2